MYYAILSNDALTFVGSLEELQKIPNAKLYVEHINNLIRFINPDGSEYKLRFGAFEFSHAELRPRVTMGELKLHFRDSQTLHTKIFPNYVLSNNVSLFIISFLEKLDKLGSWEAHEVYEENEKLKRDNTKMINEIQELKSQIKN